MVRWLKTFIILPIQLGHLSSELEDLKLLRSLSPYSHSGRNSRSSRHLSHSPRPHKSDASVLQQQQTPAQTFDSRPDIAAWPAPPGPSASQLSSNPPQPASAIRQPHLKLPQQQSHQIQPTTNISLSISPAPSIQIGSHPHASPFHSPHPSPIPTSPRPSSSITAYEDSSKLLSMLKVVAAHSPSVRGRESELRQKIQALEETVRDYENQKYSVLGTFSEYREKVAERERHLEGNTNKNKPQ